MDLKESVQFVKGVGPSRLELLNSLGIFTVEDLINYYPRAYEDRSKIKKIAELQDGECGVVEAVVVSNVTTARIRKRRKVYKRSRS